ncbi:Cancer susceptibility candidate 1 [Perkinsus chesapeaki]|uniref:Cancer susceptibility candidate 1 n=1 Tax=Perkinsus chesapeaki TaxID=330153 RepID=A0A7J6M106_PERCH|nr:Cancer susceptibility candidate 1 [Perkinsus chesapeaki]
MGKKGGAPKKSKKQLEEEALKAKEDARKEADAAKFKEMAERLNADAVVRGEIDKEREKAKEDAARLEMEAEMVEKGKSKRWRILGGIKQTAKDRVEWERFLSCTGRPNVNKEAEINTFEDWLNSDAEEGRQYSISQCKPGIGYPFTVAPLGPAAATTSLSAVLESFPPCTIERALALGHLTEFTVDDFKKGYIKAVADADLSMMCWCLNHIQRIRTLVLAKHLDYATGHLFQFIEDVGVSNRNEVQATWGQAGDVVFLAFWAFLQNSGFRAKLIDLPKFKMTIELPKSVATHNLGHCLGARIVYTRYDSSGCFVEPVLQSESRTRYGSTTVTGDEDDDDDQKRRHDSGEEEWVRQDCMGRRPHERGYGRASLPPRYAVGGVVHVDVVSLPRMRYKQQGWLIRSLPPDTESNYIRLPYPGGGGMGSSSQIQPCRVEYRIPKDVVIVDKPQIAWRNLHTMCWCDDGIADIQWDPSTRKVNFSARLLAPFAATVLRYEHFPYMNWSIHILPPVNKSVDMASDSVLSRSMLTLETALGLEVKLELTSDGVHLVAPELTELHHLRLDENSEGIYWPPAVLLTNLREAGINLMPVDEDAQWLSGSMSRRVKEASLELQTCTDLAEAVVLMRHDLVLSKHNRECGRERIVVKARANPSGAADLDDNEGEDDDENKKAKEYKVVMVCPNKCGVIEDDDAKRSYDSLDSSNTHYSVSMALGRTMEEDDDDDDFDIDNSVSLLLLMASIDPPRFILILSSGSTQSTSKPLTKPGDVLTMGRLPHCDIVFKSNAISGSHCSFTYMDKGNVKLADTSFNGTYVNGELIGKGKSVYIKSGDRIGLAPSPSRLRAASAPPMPNEKTPHRSDHIDRPKSAVVASGQQQQLDGKAAAGCKPVGRIDTGEATTSAKSKGEAPRRGVRGASGRGSIMGHPPPPQGQSVGMKVERSSTQNGMELQATQKHASSPTGGDIRSTAKGGRQQAARKHSARSIGNESERSRIFGLNSATATASSSSGSCWLCPKRKEREESLVTETKALRARLASREGELATLEERLQESELTMTLKKRKLATVEEKYKEVGGGGGAESYAELKARCEGLVNAGKKGKAEREDLVERLNSAEARANTAESELIYSQERVHELQQKLDEECRQSNSLMAELQEARQHCSALGEDLKEAMVKLEQVLGDSKNLEGEVERLREDTATACSIAAAREGAGKDLVKALLDSIKKFEDHGSFGELPPSRPPVEVTDISPVKMRSKGLNEEEEEEAMDPRGGGGGGGSRCTSMTQEVVSELAQSLPKPSSGGQALASMTQCSVMAQMGNSTSSIDGVSLASADMSNATQNDESIDAGVDGATQGKENHTAEEPTARVEEVHTCCFWYGMQLPATMGMMPPPPTVTGQQHFDDDFMDEEEVSPRQEIGGTFDDLAEFDIDGLEGGQQQQQAEDFSDDFADFDNLSPPPPQEAPNNDDLLADFDLDGFSPLSLGGKARGGGGASPNGGGIDDDDLDAIDFDDF